MFLAKGYTLKPGTPDQGICELVRFTQYVLQALLYRNRIAGAASYGPTIEIALRKHSSSEVEKLIGILYSSTLASGLVSSSEGVQTTFHILHKNLEDSEKGCAWNVDISTDICNALGRPASHNTVYELSARFAVGKVDFEVREKDIYNWLWTDFEWV
jgi:hypothetical protein